MKRKTKRIVSTLLVCGAMFAEAGAACIMSFGKVICEARQVKADDEVAYTLDTTKVKTGNNTYGKTGTVTYESVGWSFTGNGEQQPWRLGGKTAASGDQPFYTTTAVSGNIARIEVLFGSLSGLTPVSFKMSVHSSAADAASGSNAVESHTGLSIGANTTASITLNSAQSSKFYRFVPNVSISSSSNKYLELKSVTFFKEKEVLTQYNVKFDANGGTGTMSDYGADVATYTVPACTFVPPMGKEFNYWAVGSTTGTPATVGSSITLAKGTTTIYAVWKDIVYDDVPAGQYSISFLASDYTKLPSGNFAIKPDADGKKYAPLVVTSSGGSTKNYNGNIEWVAESGSWVKFETTSNAKIADVCIDYGSGNRFVVNPDNGNEANASTATTVGSTANRIKYFVSGKSVTFTASGASPYPYSFKVNLEYSNAVQLNAPTDFTYSNNVLSWPAITGAISYKYSVNGGAEQTASTNSISSLSLGKYDFVTVYAVGDGLSYSDSLKGTYDNTNYGTLENPLTVSEADAVIVAQCGTTKSALTRQPLVIKGKMVSDLTYNATNQYFEKGASITDNSKTLAASSSYLNDTAGYAQNLKAGDEVIIMAFGEYYNGNCLYTANGVNVQLLRFVTITLTSIEITNQPSKKVYNNGETFDPTGIKVMAHYDDGTSKEVTSSVTYSQLTSTSTKVTVSYTDNGVTKTADITGIDVKTFSKITVEGQKTSFTVGEKFEFGGTVYEWFTHSNGTAESMGSAVTGYTLSKSTSDTLTYGLQQKVTVTYNEKTVDYNISVDYAPVSDLTFPSELELGVNGDYDFNNAFTISPASANQAVTFSIKAQGTTISEDEYDFDSGYLLIGENVSTSGTITVVATTTGLNSSAQPIVKECVVTVSAVRIPVLTGITVGGTATKGTQYVGKTFDPSGLTFTPVYDITNEEPDVITADDILWNSLVAGQAVTGKLKENQSIVVNVGSLVTVENDAVASIAFAEGCDLSVKDYTNEDNFVFTGLSIVGTMKSGDSATINQANVTYTAAKQPSAIGIGIGKSVEITATYEGKTATKTFTGIKIISNVVKTIAVVTSPSKTNYVLGEDLNLEGLKVNGTFTNNAVKDVTANISVSGYDKFSVGEQTITVTAPEGGTGTATFKVTVAALVEQDASSSFDKVTANLEDFSGTYLILTAGADANKANFYYAFNGGISTPKDAQTHVDVSGVWTNNSNSIAPSDNLNAIAVTIDKVTNGDDEIVGYVIKGVADDAPYITKTANSNGMDYKTSLDEAKMAYVQISIDEDGYAIINGYGDTTGALTALKYNKNLGTSGEMFRFYKDGGTAQTPIMLFKLNETPAVTGTPIKLNTPTYTKEFSVGETVNISDLTTTALFNTNENKTVTGVTFSDGTTQKTLTQAQNVFDVKYVVGGKTLTASVTIAASATVKVSGITVTGNADALLAGETKQLTATVTPDNAANKEVTWTSENTNVATVSDTGLVTAKEVAADGTTVVIKATAKDGSGAYGEFTVTVNKDDVNGIQLAESNAMKTSYTYGETFDPSGLVIQEVYESGKLGNAIAYAGHESDFTLGIAANKPLDHDDTSCSVSYGGFALANPIALTINKKAVSLEVTGYNDSVIEGTDYEIGDDYTATVTYSDNTTGTVTLTEVVAADTSTFGTTTVTAKATVGGVELTDTFNVTVEKDVAVSMTVDNGPAKHEYNHNETFNGEGVKITVTFACGKTETHEHGDEGVSYNLSTLSEVGSKTLEVSYTDKYGTKVSSNSAQPIVVSKVAQSLAITGYNDSIYAGQAYELGDDAVATVTYSDGTTGTIDIPNDVVVNIDNETVGTATASVTINGLTATFDVTVKEDEVDHIQIFGYGGDYTYTHKEAFNPEGLQVTVYYKSGNTEDVFGGDERLSYSPATFDTVGDDIEVTVTFTDSQGNTAETYMPQKFTVVKYVDEVEVNSFELYKNYDASGTNTPLEPYDPIYQSDNITAKVVVDVTYSDGSPDQKEGIVSLGGLVQGNNAKAITFEGLEGKQVTLNINGVLGDELTGLTVDTTAMKTDGYIEGQSVDFEGLVITGHYATGAEKEILLSDCTVTGDTNLKVGPNEIKLEFDGKEATFEVVAMAKSVTGIELVGTQAETYFLESELASIGANGYQIKVTYDNGKTDTIDIADAIVSYENGVVAVTYEGKTATYEITVLDKSNIASITIENESGTATKDVAYTFNPGTVTAHYEGTNKTLVLDATDYTVDAVAVSEVGDATYDVTLNGTDIKASFTVSVSYADVTGVTISGEVPATIRPNDQVTLSAIVAPENANGEVTWSSSDETVATVENGVVTFLKEGTVTITATSVQDPTQKATKELSCQAIHVTDVVIAEEEVNILEGNNATLHVTVNPEDAANPAVTFTSGDETIATVSANGVVTGVKFGTTTITVTSVDGGKTDTVVIVVHVRINGVTITDEVKESYLPKETLQLHATVDCSDTSQGVIWSTSNKLIATVTEDGFVRFFKDGKVVITATSELDPTKSASIELVVHTPYVAMTELQVAQGEASMVVGDELQLNWTIAPVDATDMTLKFVSNNEEVAKVDENGLITAVGPGTTMINISSKDGSLTATCEVTVVAKVTGVSLNETTKTIEEGQTFTLTATVNPENAPNKAVTWETSDASIATVSNGVVTALKAGEVTITVKTNDGNKVASCVVTVTAKPANQGDNGEGGAGVIDNVLNKLGCKGSIAATSALISLATLAGAGLALSKKRKKEDK